MGAYRCNPYKHVKCPKTHCFMHGGECCHTLHIEYALEDDNLKIKLIDFGYKKAPAYAHENDAGADVCIIHSVVIEPHKTVKLPLGFGLEMPDGYAAFVYPRSGMASLGIVCELPPIDSGYRGEVHAIVTNHSNIPVTLKEGQRVGQLVITPVIIADFITHNIKERGTGAFGSTGE